ncbi:MAG TPA: LuxR C-terminal-related transcriptional regulator [Patescibacteria group bacterium]|nr:LuxR C-terminal-related transcriptional regulator [Patescibacteria group bacterium]
MKKHEFTGDDRLIAALIADGRTNREISEAMFLAPDTIRKYIIKLADKLDVPAGSGAGGCRAQIVARAFRKGLLE